MLRAETRRRKVRGWTLARDHPRRAIAIDSPLCTTTHHSTTQHHHPTTADTPRPSTCLRSPVREDAAAAEDSSGLLTLPPELLALVAAYLPARSAVRLSGCCRRLNELLPFCLSLVAAPVFAADACARRPHLRMVDLAACLASPRLQRWSRLGAVFVRLPTPATVATAADSPLAGAGLALALDATHVCDEDVDCDGGDGSAAAAEALAAAQRLFHHATVLVREVEMLWHSADPGSPLHGARRLLLAARSQTGMGEERQQSHLPPALLEAGCASTLVLTDVHRLDRICARRRDEGEAGVAAASPLRQLELHDARLLGSLDGLPLDLRELTVTNSYRLRDLAPLRQLRQLRRVCLDGCISLTDVSALEGVAQVSLQRCAGLVDVSPLRSASQLDLTGCSMVADVGALGKVLQLSLKDCHLVTDVSGLDQVRVLDLRGCYKVCDVSGLVCVENLHLGSMFVGGLSRLSRLRVLLLVKVLLYDKLDLAAWPCLERLELTNSSTWTRLPTAAPLPVTQPAGASPVRALTSLVASGALADDLVTTQLPRLAHLQELVLEDCEALTNVALAALVGPALTSLTLLNCSNVSDLSPAAGVQRLRVARCKAVADVSMLGALHSLALVALPSVSDVSALGSVRQLELADLPLLRDVSGLGRVEHLVIRNCQLVADVSQLANVRCAQLARLPAVRDVSALANASAVSLVDCPSISSVVALAAVPRLHLEDLPNLRSLEGLGVQEIAIHNKSFAQLIRSRCGDLRRAHRIVLDPDTERSVRDWCAWAPSKPWPIMSDPNPGIDNRWDLEYLE